MYGRRSGRACNPRVTADSDDDCADLRFRRSGAGPSVKAAAGGVMSRASNRPRLPPVVVGDRASPSHRCPAGDAHLARVHALVASGVPLVDQVRALVHSRPLPSHESSGYGSLRPRSGGTHLGASSATPPPAGSTSVQASACSGPSHRCHLAACQPTGTFRTRGRGRRASTRMRRPMQGLPRSSSTGGMSLAPLCSNGGDLIGR